MASTEEATYNSLPLKLAVVLNLGLWSDQFASWNVEPGQWLVRIGNGMLIELLKYKRESNASNN